MSEPARASVAAFLRGRPPSRVNPAPRHPGAPPWQRNPPVFNDASELPELESIRPALRRLAPLFGSLSREGREELLANVFARMGAEDPALGQVLRAIGRGTRPSARAWRELTVWRAEHHLEAGVLTAVATHSHESDYLLDLAVALRMVGEELPDIRARLTDLIGRFPLPTVDAMIQNAMADEAYRVAWLDDQDAALGPLDVNNVPRASASSREWARVLADWTLRTTGRALSQHYVSTLHHGDNTGWTTTAFGKVLVKQAFGEAQGDDLELDFTLPTMAFYRGAIPGEWRAGGRLLGAPPQNP